MKCNKNQESVIF